LQKNESKPAESKKDFAKQTVEEQLREVWLYANEKITEIETSSESNEKKKEKRKRYDTSKIALESKEFRSLFEQYKEYRRANKFKWYKSAQTLYTVVENLALLAGLVTPGGAAAKINIEHAKDIYNFSTVQKNYQSFVKLPEYLQTPKETRNTQTQAPALNYKPTRRMSEIADLDAPL
jgi:hypothetical protein